MTNKELNKKRDTQRIDNKIAKLQLEYNRLHRRVMFLILDKDWDHTHDALDELIAYDAKLKSAQAELAKREGEE